MCDPKVGDVKNRQGKVCQSTTRWRCGQGIDKSICLFNVLSSFKHV